MSISRCLTSFTITLRTTTIGRLHLLLLFVCYHCLSTHSRVSQFFLSIQFPICAMMSSPERNPSVPLRVGSRITSPGCLRAGTLTARYLKDFGVLSAFSSVHLPITPTTPYLSSSILTHITFREPNHQRYY
jgi:hypothetical protein